MRMDTYTTLSTLAAIALLSCLSQALDVTTQEQATHSTTPAPFRLNLAQVQSSTSSIEVKWSVPVAYELSAFHIEAIKTDEESEGTMVSPDNPSNTSSYIVSDLMTNSPYKICILASEILSTLEQQSVQPYEECIEAETIPIIRHDSLIALFIVFGYLLLMILIGYFCWRHAHNKAEKAAMEEEVEETKTNGDQSQPILMVSPPPGEGPKSGIEDSDIPYITPTWDELEKEKKAGK